jgi:hypothetical protein
MPFWTKIFAALRNRGEAGLGKKTKKGEGRGRKGRVHTYKVHTHVVVQAQALRHLLEQQNVDLIINEIKVPSNQGMFGLSVCLLAIPIHPYPVQRLSGIVKPLRYPISR